MLLHIANFLKGAFRWIRYLYFLRFSLLLLAFAPMLIVLNTTGASSLLRGILVPEYWQQYLCVAFFLVSQGFAALILARVVLINGSERFNEGVPTLLKTILVSDRGHWLSESAVLLLFQIPTLTVFFLMYGGSTAEDVPALQVGLGLAAGAVLAVFVWWAANAWFYLTYDASDDRPEPMIVLGKNAARTMLFPRAWFGLLRPGTLLVNGQQPTSTLESAYTPLRGSWIDQKVVDFARISNQVLKLTGYLYPDGSPYEGHIFATVATFLFGLVYVLIWPLAAPVPALVPTLVVLALLFIAAAAALIIFWGAKGESQQKLIKWQITLTVAVAGFPASVAALYFFASAERFPVFAVILLLVTLIFWGLGAIAFFADRYRVPVLSTIIALMILPRILGVYGGNEEHYLSTVSVKKIPPAAGSAVPPQTATGSCLPQSTPGIDVQLPTPACILDTMLKDPKHAGKPLIIVTSTGGGLHASAWTSAVLAQLELEFKKEDIDFHQNVLLMSTVSGGSVGLLSYLREINEPWQDWVRMQSVAQCSSLEAAGWGLAYYDFPKAVIPLAPFLFPLSTGDNDLDTSPLAKDRTWSLRKAFARNMINGYCDKQRPFIADYFGVKDNWTPPSKLQLQDRSSKPQQEIDRLETGLTVRKLLTDQSGHRPAFTMNSTTVERGERFLLANYRIPQHPLDSASDYPAQSFVDTLGCCKDQEFDLPLATAAQLSATFPLVSSAARAPEAADWHSVHFVDGGYYDNDGTASILEFLRYALAEPEFAKEPNEKTLLADIKTRLEPDKNTGQRHPLRILLVEIRNSGDPELDDEIQDKNAERLGGGRGAQSAALNLLGQLMAPLEGFWNAGHQAVTGRNRASLSLLEQAFHQKLQIQRIEFDDRNSDAEVGTDPLSWSLTPRQRTEVLSSSCPRKMNDKYAFAANLFKQPAWVYSDSDLPAQELPVTPGSAVSSPPPLIAPTNPAPQEAPKTPLPAKQP